MTDEETLARLEALRLSTSIEEDPEGTVLRAKWYLSF